MPRLAHQGPLATGASRSVHGSGIVAPVAPTTWLRRVGRVSIGFCATRMGRTVLWGIRAMIARSVRRDMQGQARDVNVRQPSWGSAECSWIHMCVTDIGVMDSLRVGGRSRHRVHHGNGDPCACIPSHHLAIKVPRASDPSYHLLPRYRIPRHRHD